MLNEDEARPRSMTRAGARDEVKAEDEDETTGAADQDEETGAADGAATATGWSRRTGYASTVPKRGTSNRTVQFENDPPRQGHLALQPSEDINAVASMSSTVFPHPNDPGSSIQL